MLHNSLYLFLTIFSGSYGTLAGLQTKYGSISIFKILYVLKYSKTLLPLYDAIDTYFDTVRCMDPVFSHNESKRIQFTKSSFQ